MSKARRLRHFNREFFSRSPTLLQHPNNFKMSKSEGLGRRGTLNHVRKFPKPKFTTTYYFFRLRDGLTMHKRFLVGIHPSTETMNSSTFSKRFGSTTANASKLAMRSPLFWQVLIISLAHMQSLIESSITS